MREQSRTRIERCCRGQPAAVRARCARGSARAILGIDCAAGGRSAAASDSISERSAR